MKYLFRSAIGDVYKYVYMSSVEEVIKHCLELAFHINNDIIYAVQDSTGDLVVSVTVFINMIISTSYDGNSVITVCTKR